MDEEFSLESYLDQCSSQDGFPSTSLQGYPPMSPFGTDLPISSTPDALFGSPLGQTKHFPSVDLSFLPDDFCQDEKDGGRVLGEQLGSQLGTQDSGVFFDDGDLSQRRDGSATEPLPESSGACPPMTPMTPMTPITPSSEGSGIVPQLQNIVATVNLACKLDLKNIALHARNAEYNPKRFAAVIMRIREPRTTALIFSSGKMVCTGAKSEEQSRLAARKYARVVQKLGFPAKFLDFKIQNMVGSCDVRFPIRLEGLVLTHQQFSRFSEKKERLKHLRSKQHEFQSQLLKAMEGKKITDQLRWKIMSCKMRIEQLKQTICKENEEMSRNSEWLLRIKDENQKLYRRAQRHQEKKEKIQRHNRKLGELVEKRSYDLRCQHEQLANLRRSHVLELTSIIFPIEEVKIGVRDPADVSSESDSAMTSSTVSKLAEARRTTYLSGRWVCDDHNGDTSIGITGPWMTLPNNGDYSAYYNWVEEKRTTPGPDMEHNNPAYTISAALCYATQLVNILSHLLDVNLPKKLSNSEFCGENLSRRKFTWAVKKLNANILYLCFSQHVNLDLLHPLHTLRNLMYLVSPETEHLGRSGPFEISADLEDSMEFVDPSGASETDESGDEHISDEETDLGTDWENLPSPRFCDIPSQPLEMLQSQSTQASQPIASSSSAGGMISSAAASVTSWFKAYTGHR